MPKRKRPTKAPPMDWLPKGKEIVEEFDINPPNVGNVHVIRSNEIDETDAPLPPIKPSKRTKK